MLERSEQLALLRGLFADATAGRGHLVCVSAEAGGGKSALIQAFADSVATQAPTLTGWCDPCETPRPAGPLLDMGAGLGDSVVRILREDGRAGLFDAVLAHLAECGPTVLMIEDVHWADGATLDFLRFLGRRVAILPALVVVTYRGDEIGPGHPLRAVLGDLATQRGVERMELPALSLAAVTALAADRDVDPARVLDVTGGNPFFVTEVVAHRDLGVVPESVTDTVLARLGRISMSARHAVTVAAMTGSRAEPSLLYDVPGVTASDLDEAVQAGIMRLTPPFYTFRHELVREAVLSVTAAAERRRLAASVLAVRRQHGVSDDDLGRLAEIADSAEDASAVLEYAPAAARRAVELGAHREAAAQYARALRYVSDEQDRAEYLQKMAVERYLVGDLEAAIAAGDQLIEVRRAAGQLTGLGDAHRWLSRYHWYAGDGATALRHARWALEQLEPLGPSPELAMAMSSYSQLRMVSGFYAEAISWGERALALSRELDLPDVTAHALNNVGTATTAIGDLGGLDMLRESLAVSLVIGSEDHAARAYVNLGGELVSLRRISEAMAVADAGIEYCSARDLDLQTPYLRSVRAQAAVHAGRWDEAVAEARSVLQTATSTSLHQYVACLPLAAVAVRRGEPADLDDLARRAFELDELQRLVPYACVRAEALWLAGETVPADSDILAIYERGTSGDFRPEMTDLGLWLGRLGVPVPPDVDAHGPMRGAYSDPVPTARRLGELGNVYDAAICLLHGDEADVRAAADTLASLGAGPALAKAQARLRELGAVKIPRGPHRSTAANEWGLTARQLEVLALLADGLTNVQIAGRLFLSERTVEHHVSAVLGKLGAATRDEAARKSRYRPAPN